MMRAAPLWACALLLVTLAGAPHQPDATPVEHESRWWSKGQGGRLGTNRYTPSNKEQPLFRRLPTDEVVTGSLVDSYDISTRDKKYVGWFGIVRRIDEDTRNNRTVLTVEHKYFDGLTDAHIQAVSFNGSGDFQATLAGTGHRIPPLSLVKVYGTVTQGKQGSLPRIGAAFVRNWHWGTFTFLAAYGTQRGSEEWRKANRISLDDIYEAWPHPCHHYYEERLGKRPDGPQIRQRLLAAAGTLSREAGRTMDRLASLLAVGHPWSPAETMRQSKEFSQICDLVRTTESQKAAVKLLLQALRENDERVSWSATDKFGTLDPAGDAVSALVRLLDEGNARVRAGAARALSLGYGVKAAPAVAALSRCVADTDDEVQQYAIHALADIGPVAKAAVPTLKNALTDEDQGTRVNAAQSLWAIEQEPGDVVSVLVTVLEYGNEDERGEAAAQMEAMGPWAEPAVPALIKALTDKEWSNRCMVTDALGAVGPKAAKATPALAKIVQKDEDPYVRAKAAEALAKVGESAAIPILVAALEDEDDGVRFSAIHALETLGYQAKVAVPALTRAVRHDDSNGWVAASALGAVDAEGISTSVLIESLGDQDPRMRRFAAVGLSGIGRKASAAEKALLDGLRDSDPDSRIAAALAYWSVSGKADEAVRVLRSDLQATGHWNVQVGVAHALAKMGPAAKPAVPELIACLRSDTESVVTSAAEALGMVGPGAASAVLALTAKMEGVEDHYSRARIARALWRINRSEASLAVVYEILTNARDSMALTEAAGAIGEMGAAATGGATPRLLALLKHRDPLVRRAAAGALKQIDRK